MDITAIQNKLITWYLENAQTYPWREDPTPYHVWISEIMLQQTRIEAALPYYQRFIEVLPNVQALAEIPQEELLKLWEGLGYYSRAKNLQKAAQIIVREYAGQLPSDYTALLSLPGVGAYTAGAIASIAYDISVPAVDGNVMRVLARLTNDNVDVLSTEGKKHFTELAKSLVPDQQAGAFNQALMELGEKVCLPNAAPRCSACPLLNACEGARCGTAADLPTRIKKTRRRIEQRSVALILWDGDPSMVLLRKRGDVGLLAGMWEFPNAIDGGVFSAVPEELTEHCEFLRELPPAKHLFSHIEWQMHGNLFLCRQPLSLSEEYRWVTFAELKENYPIPGAFQFYKAQLDGFLHKES